MSDDQKNQTTKKARKQENPQEAPNFEDLTVTEPEVEVLSSEDARAIPEVGASIADNFCCTATSSSL